MKKFLSRQNVANFFIVSGIVFVGVGISLVNIGVGLASGGLCCLFYGYLLGAE